MEFNLVRPEFRGTFFPHRYRSRGKDQLELSFVGMTKDSRTVWIRTLREHEASPLGTTVYANTARVVPHATVRWHSSSPFQELDYGFE